MKKLFMPVTLLLTLLLSAPANAGLASWYGPGFHGKRTASGAIYNMYAMTAAHKSLPFGSKVKVTNLKNNKSVVVKITDRGPFAPGRIIDLSKKANQSLNCNLCKVTVEVLSKGDGKYRKQ
ncbi:septal ring lytic transglycosylase RlpA family protein [Psychrobacter sp. YP14]|jgi:rare lipoprotein A|uniref:Endolytic peptidoglycan transglycosylase RlpA n=2 Tax=Psychrobacter TaxID=497 RepID=A0A844M1J8_9GAMM|nr:MULTISPECIES: septal ring lytic transglycosylase RlpA family protein [Psychrobacter]AWT49972.1 septal ring lytic transglycosylase RlpA family protein [Psychrobacter sp. YP14]MUG32625.1 septal ring lytic transglycosylase RlpA family protein [Psychrobacter sanguinis]